jgi:hypothetical protein
MARKRCRYSHLENRCSLSKLITPRYFVIKAKEKEGQLD